MTRNQTKQPVSVQSVALASMTLTNCLNCFDRLKTHAIEGHATDRECVIASRHYLASRRMLVAKLLPSASHDSQSMAILNDLLHVMDDFLLRTDAQMLSMLFRQFITVYSDQLLDFKHRLDERLAHNGIAQLA